MKLWRIKANALRLMFADSDMNFDEAEFTADGNGNRVVYDNNNTREKLVLMDESISRAIDKYYSIVGESTKLGTFNLKLNVDVYENELDISTVTDFGFPTRMDVEIYDDDGEGNKTHRLTFKQIDFLFDPNTKQILFYNDNFTDYEDNAVFKVFYKTAKQNLPDSPDEITFDLDTLGIPAEVQRHIPYFVKGELYEEDEPNVAEVSMQKYVSFLYGLRKPFSNVQTKVKRSRVFDK